VTVTEVAERLSELIDQALAGDEIITEGGKPMAKLEPFAATHPPATSG
jgi:antitoxin (DNA-binding transcriptional repressor) of toxin-antitoxin stability system